MKLCRYVRSAAHTGISNMVVMATAGRAYSRHVHFFVTYSGGAKLLLPLPFYPRDAMLARVFASCDSDVSVRLSVRSPDVCHTPVLCYSRAKACRIVKCTPPDSPMIIVSGKVWVVEKFARGHPKGTCQMRVGWVFRRFSTSRHLENGAF